VDSREAGARPREWRVFRVEHGPGRRIAAWIHVKRGLDRVSGACTAWNTGRVTVSLRGFT